MAIDVAEVIDRSSSIPALNFAACDKIMDRFDRLRNANGGTPTAVLRDKMQRAMQDDAAVFRTQETLENGCKRVSEIWGELADVKPSRRRAARAEADKSPIALATYKAVRVLATPAR